VKLYRIVFASEIVLNWICEWNCIELVVLQPLEASVCRGIVYVCLSLGLFGAGVVAVKAIRAHAVSAALAADEVHSH
jgi:hypothetical protein